MFVDELANVERQLFPQQLVTQDRFQPGRSQIWRTPLSSLATGSRTTQRSVAFACASVTQAVVLRPRHRARQSFMSLSQVSHVIPQTSFRLSTV